MATVEAGLATKITSSGGYTYIGEAWPQNGVTRTALEAKPVWRASRIDSNGSIEWADGSSGFDNVATDLTALSYS